MVRRLKRKIREYSILEVRGRKGEERVVRGVLNVAERLS